MLTVDWPNQIIHVPKTFMTLVQSVPQVIYNLDLEVFRQALQDLQVTVQGRVNPIIHEHIQPQSFGGTTLGRGVVIINGYTITFEDDQYAVNIIGGNSNVADVTNVNQVSVRPNNSAGLVHQQELADLHLIAGLVRGVPTTITKTGLASGTITLQYSGDGENTTTITRTDT